MSDQENQETQDSGQALAEVQQEAPATSETTAVDQNVQAGEDEAPEVQAASQPGEAPQAEEAPTLQAEEAPVPQAEEAPAPQAEEAPALQAEEAPAVEP